MISEKRSSFANVKTRYGRLGRDQHNSDGLMSTNFVTIDIICLSFYLQNEEFSFSFFFPEIAQLHYGSEHNGNPSSRE